MQIKKTGYNPELLEKWRNKLINENQITRLLSEFVAQFEPVIRIKNQITHFTHYLIGLMSNLDRKSVEPIALATTGAGGVRSLQQFMSRSPLDDHQILDTYQKLFGDRMSSVNGMLSVDSSENAKKGKNSAGVGRQYCGRLGKVENC